MRPNRRTTQTLSLGLWLLLGATCAAETPELLERIRRADPRSPDVIFTIRADRPPRPIDPRIYGSNSTAELARTRPSLLRLGGNRMTAYNWENNASNAGSDWFFQNDNYLDASEAPGKVALDLVETAARHGATAVVTIPIVDHVAADKNGGGDVRGSGDDYLATRFRRNHAVKPGVFSERPDTRDADVYQDEFVAWLRGNVPDGADVLFSMDNEPDLWAETHAPVHPEKVSFRELWDRNRRYATAVKRAWPNAPVLGVVSYGFHGFVTLQDAPDREGREFLDWYLEQAKAAHDASGQRLIDYLDLHWYPEARGGGRRIIEASNEPAVVQARIQAPRSLWDDRYLEDSWIGEVRGKPINLLHWLERKIDTHYPGTKLAFTEWNYGGGNHISGAIAVADVLGIFGRHGVGAAAYWPVSGDESFAWAAFRAYRNYDGKGARFGDLSIDATSSDPERASVYASVESDDPGRTVVIAISKSPAPLTAVIRPMHAHPFERASVFVLAGSRPELRVADPLQPSSDNTFVYELPPYSVSVLELH